MVLVLSLFDICLGVVVKITDSLGWCFIEDLPQHVLSSIIDLLPIKCLNNFHEGLKNRGVDSQKVWMRHYIKNCKTNNYTRRREFLFTNSNKPDWRQLYLDHRLNRILRQLVQQRICGPNDGDLRRRLIEFLSDPFHAEQSRFAKTRSRYYPKTIKIWGSACNILANCSDAQKIIENSVEEIIFEHLSFQSQSVTVFKLLCNLLKSGKVFTLNFKDVKLSFFTGFLFRCHESKKEKLHGTVDANTLLYEPTTSCSLLSQLKKVSFVGVSFHEVNLDMLKYLFLCMENLNEIELVDNDIPSGRDILSDLGLNVNSEKKRLPSVISYEQNIISGCFETLQNYIHTVERNHCVTHLSLEFCFMSSEQISLLFNTVSENKNIIFLSVFGNQCDSCQPSLIKLFQDGRLQALDLGQTKFTLSQAHGFSDSMVTKLLANMMSNKFLRYLGLASTKLTDACLLKLATGLTDQSLDSQLNKIDISFNNRISSEGLRTFGRKLLEGSTQTKLTHLRLEHNYTSGVEQNFFHELHRVVKVYLAGPSEDTDTDFSEHVANM